jgi:4-hydroxy-tetrahydrodipicolinate synthase
MSRLSGVFPSLVTVCDDSGDLDEEGERAVVRFCIEKGANGIACLLFAGEFYKFSDAERRRIAEIVIDEANGKVPVLVGTSHAGTKPCIELSKHAQDAGADGVIITPPYHSAFVIESSLALNRHFEQISRNIDIPIMIQDRETLTGVHMCASDLVSVMTRCSNIQSVKIEGIGHLRKIADILRLANRKLPIFGGMAGRYFLEELDLGVAGTIPGAAIPEATVHVYKEFIKGNRELATATFNKFLAYLNFFVLNTLAFVAVEKEALKARGIIRSSNVREPAVFLKRADIEELTSVLRKIEVIS